MCAIIVLYSYYRKEKGESAMTSRKIPRVVCEVPTNEATKFRKICSRSNKTQAEVIRRYISACVEASQIIDISGPNMKKMIKSEVTSQLKNLVKSSPPITGLPEMVAIPGGTFLMGSPDGEGHEDERPRHEVTIQPFSMSKYPITQFQWRYIANQTELKVDVDLKHDPSYFVGDNLPVEKVNWYEAIEFCHRLSKLTGMHYRLPSESEWEHACRAGTTTPFYFGKDTTKLSKYAWYFGNPGDTTHPVGMKEPNQWGLYDMYGQVWEWCDDSWHDNYEGAPTDGSAWLEGKNKNRSPLRGGSWYSQPEYCRSATRNDFVRREVRDADVGFRVVCDVQKRKKR